MPTFTRSVRIRAEREWLFWLMQNYERRLEWDEFLSEATLVNADCPAVGVRAWCVDTDGRGMETEYVSFRPPERVAVKMTRGPWIFSSFAGSWLYKEVDDATTEVTFKYHVEARPRFLRRVTDPLLTARFDREMIARLASLKERIEQLDDIRRKGPTE